MFSYSSAVRRVRLQAVKDALDAAGTPPKLFVGTDTFASNGTGVLVVFEFSHPSTDLSSENSLRFLANPVVARVTASGRATRAEIRDGNGRPVVVGLTVGTRLSDGSVSDSDRPDITLDNVELRVGQEISLNLTDIPG